MAGLFSFLFSPSDKLKNLRNLSFFILTVFLFAACDSSKHNEADSEIYLEIAKEYIQAGLTEKGLSEIENAIESNPENLDAHFLKIKALSILGKFDDALAAAGEAGKHLKEDNLFLNDHWLGVIYYHKKDYKKAIGHLEDSVKTKPDYLFNHSLLGQLYMHIGNTQKGEKNFRRAAELKPENPKMWADLGVALTWTKQYEEAKTALDKAISIDPQHAIAYNYLGRLADDQGNTKDAEKYYLKSIELDDSNQYANLNLGQLLMHENRHKEAYKYLDRAVALEPNLYHAHFWLGVFYAWEKDYEKAYEQFSKAIEQKDDFMPALIKIADASLIIGKGYDLPMKKFQKALEADTPDKEAQYFYLSRLKLAVNDPKTAMEYLEKAEVLVDVSMKERRADLSLLKGKILDKMNRRKDAEKEFKSVVEIAPDTDAAREAKELMKN